MTTVIGISVAVPKIVPTLKVFEICWKLFPSLDHTESQCKPKPPEPGRFPGVLPQLQSVPSERESIAFFGGVCEQKISAVDQRQQIFSYSNILECFLPSNYV